MRTWWKAFQLARHAIRSHATIVVPTPRSIVPIDPGRVYAIFLPGILPKQELSVRAQFHSHGADVIIIRL